LPSERCRPKSLDFSPHSLSKIVWLYFALNLKMPNNNAYTFSRNLQLQSQALKWHP